MTFHSKYLIFRKWLRSLLLKKGPVLICLLFASIYFFPVLLLKVKYCWPEELLAEVYRPQIFEALRNGYLPLWNPLAGLGGKQGIVLSVVPWDYRMFLDNLAGPLGSKWVAYLDLLFLAAAYGYAVKSLRLGARGVLVGTLIGFFYFYNLGFVKVWSAYQLLAAVLIAFPVLAGLVYKYEGTGEPKLIIPLAFFYWFSFHGGRVDYILQMNVVFVIYIFAIRWSGFPSSIPAYKKISGMVLNPRNKAYAGIIILVILANYWQLYWIYQAIGESGRTHIGTTYGAWGIGIEFLRSFQFSYVVYLYLIYLAITLFMLIVVNLGRTDPKTNPVNKMFWLSLIVGYIYFVNSYSMAWVGEDLAYWKDAGNWVLVLLLGGLLFCYVLIAVRYLIYPKRYASLLFFQFPATFLLLLYFIFENQALFNWGNGEIVKVPFYYVVTAVVLLLFSSFSRRERIRLVALMTLSAIYFLRCHLQVLSVRIVGLPWYDQRDDIYVMFFFSVLIMLGWLSLVHMCRRQLRSKHVVLAVVVAGLVYFGYGFHKMYEYSSFDPEPIKGYREFVEQKKDALRSSLDKYAPDSKYVRVSLPPIHQIPPGGMLGMNLAELEIYGSTIPQYVVNYVDKLREEEVHIKDKCRLPYLWLPNNIHRMLNCPLDDRVKLYLSKIQPNIDYYRHLDILELLGVQFVFVNERLDLPYMEFLEEVEPEEEDKPGLYLYRVLSGTSERPFGVGTFLPAPGEGEAACQWREGQDWRLVNIQTDLMGNKPIFRDRYEIGFDAPEKGCLLVPWTYSKLWSFNINGREVSPRLADTMFMSVPVEKGANAIVAHYHPRFRRHLAFSFGVTVLGVIWAVWFYMRCRKKVQGESEKEDRKKPGRGIQ